MKVLAVGDIHTKVWIVDAVESMADNYDAVVFVGDYADDWGKTPWQTIETWQALHNFQVKHWNKVHVVIGNHDYIYVNKTPTESGGYNHITQLLLNTPDNSKLKKWIQAMPIFREIDGVIYSHAGITESFKLFNDIKSHMNDVHALWSDNSPIWARPPHDYVKVPQVFGHTPSETCWEVEPNIWCIDTFSTYPNGDLIGDQTLLEVVDGQKFTKRKIQNDNNNTNSI